MILMVGSTIIGCAWLTWTQGGKREFRPKLTLFFADDLAVDAALSPDTRSFLEKRLFKQGGPKDYAENTSQDLNQEGSELPQLPNQL
jgi:hypothetical protein